MDKTIPELISIIIEKSLCNRQLRNSRRDLTSVSENTYLL